MSALLLVEDEARVAEFIRRGLKAEGHSVDHVGDGETALTRLADGRYDVVVLDLMLPGLNGKEVCRAMRARGDWTPVLMLTALSAVDEKVEGLRLGADDYLAKPFDFEELLARIEALSRRGAAPEAGAGEAMVFSGVAHNPESMETTVDGASVELSAKERELLKLFLANEGKVLSRERILNKVWTVQEDPMTNVVDVYVARLRKKIAPYGDGIKTIRGAGYRLG